jgi:hypothetical protein
MPLQPMNPTLSMNSPFCIAGNPHLNANPGGWIQDFGAPPAMPLQVPKIGKSRCCFKKKVIASPVP